MSKYSIISVEHLSKSYRLGQIGTGTLTNDLKVWWAKKRGKPNPMLKIGQTDHGNMVGETLMALNDVSFTVEQGEVLGIIGRNGAGKSTLLKILSRVTAPTSGVVKVKGRIASLLEVGTGFHPDLTGRENIYLNGAILGMTKQEIARKFDEIVDFAEIEKFIDTPVKRYSSGMYVRLAFAVAAHLESEILLVDEVLAVGDAEFQKKCLGKMGDVSSKEGRTVLFVSHNMAAVRNLCQLGLLLEKGNVTKAGVISDVIKDYLTIRKTGTETNEILGRAGQLQFHKINLNNINGQAINTVLSCEPIEFVVDYSSRNLEPIVNVKIAIRVLDNLGQSLFTFANYFTREFSRIPPRGKFVCPVPNGLPLTADNYKVTLAAEVEKGMSVVIDDVLDFTIVESDVFGSGRFPDKKKLKHGTFVIPQTPWDIKP